MILIISKPDDQHVVLLAERLRQVGATFVWIDTADFPSRMALSFSLATNVRRRILSLASGTIDLDQVRSVWWRRPQEPAAPPWITDPEQRTNIAGMATMGLGGVWESLDCLWVPGKPSARTNAHHKIWQLALAQRLGFVVPPTIVTSDPGQLLDFYAAHRGRIITKPLSVTLTQNGREATPPVTLVSRRRFRRILALRHEPVMAQRYINKRVELRITVVGDEVFTAELESQATSAGRIDWRVGCDEIHILPGHLPRSMRDRCVKLVRQMGLTYGAIDMIVTPGGEHVFLEINSSGQWGFLPGISTAIADALVRLLVRGKSLGRRPHG